MTKEELLYRLKDIEWDDLEVKEASGGIPKSMWETVGAKSGQINSSKSGQINIDHFSQSIDMARDDIVNSISKSGQINASKSGQNTDIPKGYKSGDESRAKIVEAMRNNPEISRKDLSKLLGISPSAIQRHIEFLKDSRIIIRLGSDRKGLWRVLK